MVAVDHKDRLAPLENAPFSTPWARKRYRVAQRFRQYWRATNCYKLSDPFCTIIARFHYIAPVCHRWRGGDRCILCPGNPGGHSAWRRGPPTPHSSGAEVRVCLALGEPTPRSSPQPSGGAPWERGYAYDYDTSACPARPPHAAADHARRLTTARTREGP